MGAELHQPEEILGFTTGVTFSVQLSQILRCVSVQVFSAIGNL